MSSPVGRRGGGCYAQPVPNRVLWRVLARNRLRGVGPAAGAQATKAGGGGYVRRSLCRSGGADMRRGAPHPSPPPPRGRGGKDGRVRPFAAHGARTDAKGRPAVVLARARGRRRGRAGRAGPHAQRGGKGDRAVRVSCKGAPRGVAVPKLRRGVRRHRVGPCHAVPPHRDGRASGFGRGRARTGEGGGRRGRYMCDKGQARRGVFDCPGQRVGGRARVQRL